MMRKIRHPELVEGAVQSQHWGAKAVLAIMSLEAEQSKDAEMTSSAPKSWKRRCGIGILTILAALSIAYVARFYALVGACLGMIAIIGFIMAVLSFLFGLLNWIFARKWPFDCKQATLVGLKMVSFVFLTLFFLTIFQQVDIANGDGYPPKVFSMLEQYRDSHGEYPSTLELVKDLPVMPKCLTYSVYGGNFYFSYSTGFFGPSRLYRSNTRLWEWDD